MRIIIKYVALTGTLCVLGLIGTPHYAAAAPTVLELDCVLNFNPCAPSTSYGTVTLNQVGTGISVTVDLAGSDQKFRDLTLSYGGSATTITDNDPNNTVSLRPGGFQINPFNGVFDLGGSGGKGWTGQDLYFTLLAGDGPLLLADFLGDSGGLYAALHIQNIGSATGGNCEGGGAGPACAPGVTGPGSLKIGSSEGLQLTPVPEPATMVLVGSELLGILAARRRRTGSPSK